MSSKIKPCVGILEAGPNSSDMVGRHGSFGAWFIRFFSKNSNKFSFRVFKAYDNELPMSSKECDAYVVTGSHFSVLDETKWMRKLQLFLNKTSEKQPIIGICFGHQLLHYSLGGTVALASNGWGIGVHKYSVIKNADWMHTHKSSIALCVSHSDQVVTTAPQTKLIAKSSFCPNAMTTIGKNILTLQAHPEMTKNFAAELYDTRRNQLGDELVEIALRSLSRMTDENIVSQWISNFICDRL
tara:strand:- start:681 stop:1403 length:723 start_codon:yes stop_codon:yes gene_type:complete